MASFQDAHAALLLNTALQFDFPPSPPAPPSVPPWAFGSASGGVRLMWALAVAAAVVLIALAVRVLRNRPAVSGAAAEAAPEAAAAAPLVSANAARVALGDADALAAAGRFGEAAHVLLACGVAAIGRRHPGLLRPAYTSRDITRLAGIPEAVRRTFGAIADTVELGLFGGRLLGEDDYARCRAVFVGSALAAAR